MKGCLYLNWEDKNLTTTMDKNNEKIFSCPEKIFPCPLSSPPPLSQCCINSKLINSQRVIFLKNPFSWQYNDLGQKCIILRPPFS